MNLHEVEESDTEILLAFLQKRWRHIGPTNWRITEGRVEWQDTYDTFWNDLGTETKYYTELALRWDRDGRHNAGDYW